MNFKSTLLTKLNVALFAGATVAMLAAPAAHATVVVVSPSTPIPITDSIDGIYLNVVTGAMGASGAAAPGWDINPYNNGGGFTLYGSATPGGILASGTAGTLAVALSLAPGTVISATPAAGTFYNQFQTTAAAFQTSGREYVGFRFLNEGTGVVDYGWMLFQTTAGTGFPASIVSYAYENTGASITVPVPEPSTLAMFSLALVGGLGFTALKRRRSN